MGFHGKFVEGREYDESTFANLVASSAGINLIEKVIITEEDFVRNISKVIWHPDQPLGGPGSFSQFMVSSLASNYVKVVLGGQGGDETFGGYARYLIAYLQHCFGVAINSQTELDELPISLQDMIPNLDVLKEYSPIIKRTWADGLFDDFSGRYWRIINRGSQASSVVDKSVLDFEGSFSRFCGVFNAPNVEDEFCINSMLHFDTKILLSSLLQIEDRMSMAHGLESRVPLLDHKLVEFIASVPNSLKCKNGVLKSLLKNTASNYIPESVIVRRDKMGFPTPINYWIQNGNLARDFIGDLFSSTKAKDRYYLCEKLDVDSLLTGEGSFGRSLWGLISLELWHQQFVDK